MGEEAEVKIKITADEKPAVGALERVKSALGRGLVGALNTVRSMIGNVMGAFGVFGLAAQGVQALVAGWKRIHEWMHRAATAAKALREELSRVRYANEVAAAAEAYKQLNAEIARANKLEQERNSILKQRKAATRDNYDARLEMKKQGEIAALDPAAPDYAERRKAVERKYERWTSNVAERRAIEDAGANAAELRGAAESKEREIAGHQKSLRRQSRNTMTASENWRRSGSEEDMKTFQAEADKEAKMRDTINALREEADSLRRQAAELAGAGYAAKVRNAANQQRITNEEGADAARRKAEDDRKNTERERAVAREKELAALDPSAADYDARKRAVGRKYDRLAAQAEGDTAALLALDREEREDAAREAGRTIDKANEARIDRAGSLDAFADRLAATQGVSANRLTAMGLGSGVSPREGALVGEVRKLADLMREEIEATKANKPARGDGTATYGE